MPPIGETTKGHSTKAVVIYIAVALAMTLGGTAIYNLTRPEVKCPMFPTIPACPTIPPCPKCPDPPIIPSCPVHPMDSVQTAVVDPMHQMSDAYVQRMFDNLGKEQNLEHHNSGLAKDMEQTTPAVSITTTVVPAVSTPTVPQPNGTQPGKTTTGKPTIKPGK